MTTIMVDIPNDISKDIGLENHLNIVELFEKFGIDLKFVLKEKKYSKEFLQDIKKGDFLMSNNF